MLACYLLLQTLVLLNFLLIHLINNAFVDNKCCFTVYCFIFRGYVWEMTYKPQIRINHIEDVFHFIYYIIDLSYLCASYTMIILVTELHSVSDSDNQHNTGRN